MGEIILYLAALVLAIYFFVKIEKGKREQSATSGPPRTKKYPFRAGIEFRLPNGRITTRGYAARHPTEFLHWRNGPNNVYGENIDLMDWEDWRLNYYGE